MPYTVRRPWAVQWPDRADYLGKRLDHQTFYYRMAECLGVRQLEALVIQSVAPLDRLLQSTDPHLNDIPLRRWDHCHVRVGILVGIYRRTHTQPSSWSLSDTVCVLKAVARAMIANHWGTKPFETACVFVSCPTTAVGTPRDLRGAGWQVIADHPQPAKAEWACPSCATHGPPAASVRGGQPMKKLPSVDAVFADPSTIDQE
jgi:hypothetical protein